MRLLKLCDFYFLMDKDPRFVWEKTVILACALICANRAEKEAKALACTSIESLRMPIGDDCGLMPPIGSIYIRSVHAVLHSSVHKFAPIAPNPHP